MSLFNCTYAPCSVVTAHACAQGVENVYTQHTPLLVHTLEALVKGRLRDADYPFVDKAHNGTQPPKVPKVRALRRGIDAWHAKSVFALAVLHESTIDGIGLGAWATDKSSG